MVLKLSSAGILSLLFTPVFFLLVLRIMGSSSDPLDTIFRLTIAQGLSLTFSVILLFVLKVKARVPQ